jgi:serine/threonine-protein kinase RsbW
MPVSGSNRQGGRRAGGATNGAAASGKMVFTINSNHDAHQAAQEQILDRVEKAGFTGRELFGIRLALEEALVNAIRHGNKLNPAKHVHIEARVSPKKVEFLIEDEGAGFDRRGVPDPTADENLEKCTGRGILLIEAYMSRVWWDRGGRRLRMVKEHISKQS